MRSLRSRLILGILIGITLCLALNGALVFASVRTRRYRDLDTRLDNAGLYAKYLWGIFNGMPVALAAPSIPVGQLPSTGATTAPV